MDRFTQYEFRNKKRAKNRVVVPPMASETADSNGFVTAETLTHYRRLARSGAGLVMVEYSYVSPDGRSEERQLSASSDSQITGLRELARAIHAGGSLAALQITHSGGKSSRALAGGKLWGPSGIPVPVKDQVMEAPDPMGLEEIGEWKRSFLAAAWRAFQAGFDVVELHAAHGYGLNQWLSPLTNRRTDFYGGTMEGRLRLLAEIVTAIREGIPQLLVSVRVPGQDFLEGGLTPGETRWLAGRLERLGVDVIHVSSGIGGWRRPRDRQGEGYLVNEAAAIQAVVEVPVIGVGGIETGRFIDESLERRLFGFAAVGRAILKDAKAWGEGNLAAHA